MTATIIWTYDVPAPARAEFEATYEADGAWAKLFARSADYLGTELLRGDAGTYATLDRWRSKEAFAAFKAEHADDYAALDRACAALTAAERLIGVFED